MAPPQRLGLGSGPWGGEMFGDEPWCSRTARPGQAANRRSQRSWRSGKPTRHGWPCWGKLVPVADAADPELVPGDHVVYRPDPWTAVRAVVVGPDPEDGYLIRLVPQDKGDKAHWRRIEQVLPRDARAFVDDMRRDSQRRGSAIREQRGDQPFAAEAEHLSRVPVSQEEGDQVVSRYLADLEATQSLRPWPRRLAH